MHTFVSRPPLRYPLVVSAFLFAAFGAGAGDAQQRPTKVDFKSQQPFCPSISASVNAAMDPNNLIVIVEDPADDLDPKAIVDRLGTRPVYLVKPSDAPSTPNRERIVEPNRVVTSPEHHPKRSKAIYNSVSAIERPGSSGLKPVPDWTEKALDMELLRKTSLPSEPVVVGVLDTGADSSHRQLAGQFVKGRNFVDALHGDADTSEHSPQAPQPFTTSYGSAWAYGHGSHVSGVIARIAPSAKIMPVRVLDNCGVGTVWTVLKGIVWAIDLKEKPAGRKAADVLNLSLGTHEDSEALLRVIQIAVCDQTLMTPAPAFRHPGFQPDRDRCGKKPGAFVFAGAGNNPDERMFPAALGGVNGVKRLVSVTATDEKGRLATYANADVSVDIAAPGDQIKSTFPRDQQTDQYATLSGTSMATPWLTGTAAQLLAGQGRSGPLWTSDTALMARIVQTSVPVCNSKLKEVSPVAAITGRKTARGC